MTEETVLSRLDQITQPPTVDHDYLVPTLTAEVCGLATIWPVLLPAHTDATPLNPLSRHYHLDLRFLTREQWQAISRARRPPDQKPIVFDVQSLVLQTQRDVTWRALTCLRPMPRWQGRSVPPLNELPAVYAGRQCHHNGRGWLCPHHGTDLSLIPVRGGLVTCPLHGLRIRANDGIVVDR